ncbi:tRNA-specific adenosine deaminase [Peribacillus butanolivorans]|uniref:hypothetical protein n=1 Tax=Peribacillus butanolivorans TaxID=421767 RepID=UPI0009F95F34
MKIYKGGIFHGASIIAHQNVPEKGERPFGAVIVQNGKLIAIGINDALETRNPTNQTEMKAFGKRISLRLRELSQWRPCPTCLGEIRKKDTFIILR